MFVFVVFVFVVLLILLFFPEEEDFLLLTDRFELEEPAETDPPVLLSIEGPSERLRWPFLAIRLSYFFCCRVRAVAQSEESSSLTACWIGRE